MTKTMTKTEQYHKHYDKIWSIFTDAEKHGRGAILSKYGELGQRKPSVPYTAAFATVLKIKAGTSEYKETFQLLFNEVDNIAYRCFTNISLFQYQAFLDGTIE